MEYDPGVIFQLERVFDGWSFGVETPGLAIGAECPHLPVAVTTSRTFVREYRPGGERLIERIFKLMAQRMSRKGSLGGELYMELPSHVGLESVLYVLRRISAS